MARLPNGMQKSRGDYRHPLYARAGLSPVAIARTPSPDDAAAIRAKNEADMDAFIESQSADLNAYVLSVHPKVADRDARIAVEGDTDLNHDNVEAAE